MHHKFVVVVCHTNLGRRNGQGNKNQGSIIWVIVPKKKSKFIGGKLYH